MNRQTTVWLIVLFLLLAGCARPVPQPTPIAEVIAASPACDFQPNEASSTTAEHNGNGSTNTLAFATTSSDGDIMLAHLDGTEPITLTNHPALDGLPRWSPDGTRIAFTSDRGGTWGIYLMNSEGTEVVHIGDGQGSDWSPDGQSLVFASGLSETNRLQVWSAADRVTTLLELERGIAASSWSPDGKHILFTTHKAGNMFVHLINSDGTGEHRLVKGRHPAWSPDGSFIAFRGEGADIALIKPDGSCHTVLTGDLFWSDDPAWSPDGQQIAFVSSEQGAIASQLFVMNVDGSQRRQITIEDARYSDPAWSPDGHYLAYVQKHLVQNKWTVYVLDMHNPDAQPQEIGLGSQPAWQPQPTPVAVQPTGTPAATATVPPTGTATATTRVVVLPTATPIITLPQPTPYPVTVSPISPTRRILFVEHDNLFTIQANGLELRQLTDTVGRVHSPSWSPDGQQIAFVEELNEQGDIFVIQADGSQQINLTNNSSDYAGTYWSPDGQQIAFVEEQDGQGDIFVMRADGSQRINLTDHSADDERPQWAKDSQSIVFRSTRDGQPDLYAVDVETQHVVRLTNSEQVEFARQWSPDGTRLLIQELGPNRTVVISRDGANDVPLVQASEASWSPDGTQIAFTTRERDIYGISIDVIQVNGTAQRPVTLDEHMLDSAPAWSPDGTRIAFGRRDARPAYFADNGLYVVNADGSELRQLVYLQSGGVAATWAPDGAYLLYTVDGGMGTMGVYPKPPDTVYVVGLDGTEPRAITQGWGAQWQP